MVFNQLTGTFLFLILSAGFAFGQTTAPVKGKDNQPETRTLSKTTKAASDARCSDVVLPDIAIVNITPNNSTPGFHAHPGEEIEVEVILENRGQCETGPFNVRVTVNIGFADGNVAEVVIGTFAVPSLPPTRSKEPAYYTLVVPYTLIPGKYGMYDFSAVADPENAIPEFIETNNTVERWNPQHGFIELKPH